MCYGNAIIVLWEIKMERKYGKIEFDKKLEGWAESMQEKPYGLLLGFYVQIIPADFNHNHRDFNHNYRSCKIVE